MQGLILRFLPNLLPGLSALVNPFVLVVLAVVAVGGFTAGWKVEEWRWSASLTAIAEANLKAVQDFFERQRKNNQVVAGKLNVDRAKLDADRLAFNEEFKNAKSKGPILKGNCQQPAGDAPGAQPTAPGGVVPQPSKIAAGVVCDADCIRLWHDGLAQGLPATYGGWRADAANTAPDSIDGDALIENGAANGARCNAIRSIAIGWQTKACLEGWWNGPECAALLDSR